MNESTEDFFNTDLLSSSSFRHRIPLESCSPFIFKLTFNYIDFNLNIQRDINAFKIKKIYTFELVSDSFLLPVNTINS